LEETSSTSLNYFRAFPKTSLNLAAEQERKAIQTLFNDSIEHFLAGLANGFGMRFVGGRFRFDDGKAKNYKGPYYDVYEMFDQSAPGGLVQPRLYCVNSDTHLLERVHYTIPAASRVRVETVLSGWRDFGGHKFADRITRIENGVPVLVVSIASAGVSPRGRDVFGRP
jgi:hypothetical protein